jgi:pimeloyl-ACP methyl ester carboxylesterase
MAAWKSGDVIANGIRIHYYRTGDGSKPAVVLCHGFSDSGLCWTPVARQLEADYDVIMLDARGHGLSEVVEEDYAIQSMAADVVGAIEALGLQKPVVGGHSMGGSMATFAAALAPAAIAALILEDPGYLNPPEKEPTPEEAAEQAKGFAVWVEGMAGKTREDLIAQCRAESPSWPEDELGPWADSKLQLSKNVVNKNISGGVTWQSVVAQIKCPALLITADVDKHGIVSPEMAAEAQALCPTMEVAHIPGVGHNIRREDRAAYIAAVKGFLAKWAK